MVFISSIIKPFINNYVLKKAFKKCNVFEKFFPSILQLNSNPYHYKLKFPLTLKQKFNLKLQGLATDRILKKMTKFEPKVFYYSKLII